ncbi:hypothetical protein GCM10007939_18650 [Amylibacter marinus]|uniref:Ketopantoate reductase n=1 Tax=Amylibacter marinus TaxID=1475483 RepID=A0ABQ5VWL3_9RHOB|nr:hypothetical protein [Amylibacter marinus]GLQ35582.1 hypothetical protein GCM10007939_18650 [Amylibacter marinus]
MKILILGASYGSLLSTKLLMAGHDVTLICREETAHLINTHGTEVRLKLRGENQHRQILSQNLAGTVDATTPDAAMPMDYDLIAFAMQEPQYSAPNVRALMGRIAQSKKPCLSIMNMPPLAYLNRIQALRDIDLESCYSAPDIWRDFDPDLISLCSPDPQAFRPPQEANNVLHVGLPTNFKAAKFGNATHTELLERLATDIADLRFEGQDVPVKLRLHDSLFVPLAKWSMLLAGNYRCVLRAGEQSIQHAVHADLAASEKMYVWVDELAQTLGADSADQVPFEKYARAAQGLLKPSSAARAIAAGAKHIERVDLLVQAIARSLNMQNSMVDEIVSTVNHRLAENRKRQ